MTTLNRINITMIEMILLSKIYLYIASLLGFLLGATVAPDLQLGFWLNLIITGVIGVIFAMVTMVLTYFGKKYLEERFKDIFKKKRK